MKNQELYVNSIEAAKILGVNVSSIKRWTDEGKLTCIKTAGGHRKFMMRHLVDYIQNHKKAAQKVNLFPLESEEDLMLNHHIINRNYTYLIAYMMDKSLISHADRVQQILNGLFLSNDSLHQIYDNLITPVLHQIGTLWESQKVTVFEEHIASQTIRDALIRLQGIIPIPPQKSERVFCWNLSTELHDIALKMVQHILEVRGFEIFYSGQLTPVLDLSKIFAAFRPQRLYISSSYIPDQTRLQEELNWLLDNASSSHVKVYIGGRGFDQLSTDHPAVTRRLQTYHEVFTT
jgi:excisionase family DNA binding protein